MSRQRSDRPRRKAQQERAHVTVDVILQAAARVLVDRGYAAATTNRIAGAAGVSVGTIYEYFANKEQVFDALIQRELDAVLSAFRDQPRDPGASIEAALTQVVVAGMGAMQFGPELFRALEHVPEARFRQRLAEARNTVIGLIKQLLEERRAVLRVEDLDLAAFVLVSAVEGVAANVPSDLFDERLAREIVALGLLYLTGEERLATGARP